MTTRSVLKVLRTPDAPAVATVLLADPRKGNPLGMDFWEELPRVITSLDEDDSVRAIVIASEHKHFSFGLDLIGVAPELLPALGAGAAGRDAIEQLGHVLQNAGETLARCSKPTLVAVNGWCIGAGVELALACDIRVCSEDAQFSLREVRMSMVCDLGGIQRLPYIVGEGNARLLALTGIDIGAQQALSMGLVTSVHPDAQQAYDAAHSLARTIAQNPPKVVAGVKSVMNARIASSIAVGLEDALKRNTWLMQSADFQEAMTAFMEKRAPQFQGK